VTIERKFTPEEKGKIIAAFRETLHNLGYPETCEVEYLEGPMFDTVRAWRNEEDRRSGDFPQGEWHSDLYPNPNDALASFIDLPRTSDTIAEGYLILPP
jgi:hypothetical protein